MGGFGGTWENDVWSGREEAMDERSGAEMVVGRCVGMVNGFKRSGINC